MRPLQCMCDGQEGKCGIAFTIWRGCADLLCVYRLLVGWVFWCLSDGSKNIHILFPFLCNLLVSSPGYVSCLSSCYVWKLVVYCSLSHFPLPAIAGSLLLPPAEPFACSQPGQVRNLLLTAGASPLLHPLLCLCSVFLNLRTTVPCKILLSGLPPPFHSFMCPWLHQAGIGTERVSI